MFSFIQRTRPAEEAAQPMPPASDVICFDPSGVVRAITYHLLDEHKAAGVNPESSRAAVGKLGQRIRYLSISARRWAAMKNAERLQWLLDQSHIVVKSAPSGPAMLSVRR